MTPVTSLAPLLERFFTQRLMHQRQASSHTIRSYRDTTHFRANLDLRTPAPASAALASEF